MTPGPNPTSSVTLTGSVAQSETPKRDPFGVSCDSRGAIRNISRPGLHSVKRQKSPHRISRPACRAPLGAGRRRALRHFDKFRDRAPGTAGSGRRIKPGRFTNRPYNKNRASFLAMTMFDGSARRIFWLPFLRTQAGDSPSRGE